MNKLSHPLGMVMEGFESQKVESFLASTFKCLDHKAITKLSRLALHNEYSQDDLIVQEGTLFSGIFLVFKGLISVGKYTSNRKRQIIRILDPGKYFGLESFFIEGQQTNIQFARALVKTQVLFFRKDEFLEFLKRCPQGFFPLCDWLARSLSAVEFKFVRAIGEGSLHNLAYLLLRLNRHNELENPEEGISGLTFSREIISEALGISRSNLSMLLRTLRDRKIIAVSGSDIEILNEEELERLSHNTDLYRLTPKFV